MMIKLIGTWKRLDGWQRRAVISAVTGFAASTAMLLSIVISSEGTLPRGICDFIRGHGGLLPINPNVGGDIVYSCNPDWPMSAFYTGIPWVLFSIIFWIALTILWLVASLFVRRGEAKKSHRQ